MAKRWRPLEHYSSWRKIAIGMWDRPRDPTIYGFETLDVTEALEYLDEVSLASGARVTMTALVIKAMAETYRRYPELNVVIINDRVLQREHIDVFCQVAVPSRGDEDPSGADLSGVKLEDAEAMDLVDVSRQLRGRARRVRRGEDQDIEQQKSMVDHIPRVLMRRAVKLLDFLTFNVPFDLDALGVRSDPFGSCMVSSVAPFDIRLGFAPLVPASRCPLILLPGVVFEGVKPVDGEPRVRKVMQISMTADHRAFDGLQLGYIVRSIRGILEHPHAHLPAPRTYAHHRDAPDGPPRPEDRGPRG